MADDELVSYWDVLHPPPPRPPAPPEWMGLYDHPDEEPLPLRKPVHLPFCLRCGLPFRICGGSEHKPMGSLRGFHEWQEEEKALFRRKVRLLTDGEKHELRYRLTWIRKAPEENEEDFFARRRALCEVGKIPLGRWRIELYQEVLRGR